MTTYETALLEYNSEDENGRCKLIYAYFGLAVYQSQCLEEAFSIMLWTNRIINKKAKTNKEINEIIDSFDMSKKTMGNFINEVRQAYSLSNEIEAFLTIMLERRNYLVHKYFKLEIVKFYSDKGKKEMLYFFSTFIDDAIKLDEELKKYYEDYKIKLGITDLRLSQIMDEMISKEKIRAQL